MSESAPTSVRKPTVGLFATCLVDRFRPAVGFAAARLLERAGYAVKVPQQGCCGQANHNGGDTAGARHLARAVMRAFAHCDYMVAPSGSCAAMVRQYPALFETGTEEHAQALNLAQRTWELTNFLHDVAEFEVDPRGAAVSVSLHDACTGLRELGIQIQPRALLLQQKNLSLQELEHPEVCCGFGGTFCTKYSDISHRIGGKKLDDFRAQGADCLVSIDLGCLMHLEGIAHREGKPIRALHIAEVLTDDDAG